MYAWRFGNHRCVQNPERGIWATGHKSLESTRPRETQLGNAVIGLAVRRRCYVCHADVTTHVVGHAQYQNFSIGHAVKVRPMQWLHFEAQNRTEMYDNAIIFVTDQNYKVN